MLLLLPPSETKRDGGLSGSCLDVDTLSFAELNPARTRALAALKATSRSVSASTQALDLGPTQRAEIERNRAIATSPTMPALDRYTGVLYDGIDVESLTPDAREFARHIVVIHSALFGLIGAGDLIPVYRLSHNSRLPRLSLRTHWRARIEQILTSYPGLILDLRSESYVALGPAPVTANYVRVVSETPSGRRVALSHLNKKGKGEFVRAVVDARIDHGTTESLLEWTQAAGIRLARGAHGDLELEVSL